MAPGKSLLRHSLRPRAFVLITLGMVSLACVGTTLAMPLRAPRKVLGFIAHLACRPRRRASTDELVEILWPERDSATGHHDLRQAVWQIRKRLGRDAVVCQRGEVVLNASVDSDRDQFLRAIEQGALEQAAGLYGGEFLSGWDDLGTDFDRWLRAERFRLSRLFQHTSETLAQQWASQGRFKEALSLARRARDTDPTEQRSWRLLLRSLLSLEDRVQAAAEADVLERQLALSGRDAEPDTRLVLGTVRSYGVRTGA